MIIKLLKDNIKIWETSEYTLDTFTDIHKLINKIKEDERGIK